MKKKTLILAALFAAASTVSFAATAQENWKSHCAKCHGDDGAGQTTMGKKLKLADYTTAEAQAAFTDEEAINSMRDGVKEGTKFKMVAFKEKLTEEEMLDLVKFVRAMGPQPTETAAKADCDAGKACCKEAIADIAKKECCLKLAATEMPKDCCAAKAETTS